MPGAGFVPHRRDLHHGHSCEHERDEQRKLTRAYEGIRRRQRLAPRNILRLRLAQFDLKHVRVGPPVRRHRLAARQHGFRHRDRHFHARGMMVIGPASVPVLHQHLRLPCPRRFGIIEAVAGGMGRGRGGQQQDRECCRERRKTMPEPHIVSNARGIRRSELIVIGIAPVSKTLPANPGLPMPERTSGVIDIAPAGITDHRCGSP